MQAAPSVGDEGNVQCSIPSFANGATATFILTVNLAEGTGEYTNVVNVTSTSADPNPENNEGVATVIVSSSDVSITKTGPATATAGQTISWTLTATNGGPDGATGVFISDSLPSGTTFVSLDQTSAPTAVCNTPPVGTNGLVSCVIDFLAPGSAVFILSAKVAPNVAIGTEISNTASVSSESADSNTENNSGTWTFTVTDTSADVGVSKSDTQDPVAAGNNLTYTLTVTNSGISDSQNLSLSDTVPANTTLVSFTVPAGWTRTDAVPAGGTGTVTATSSTLAAGGTSILTLVVNVNSDTPNDTVLSNTVTVSAVTLIQTRKIIPTPRPRRSSSRRMR